MNLFGALLELALGEGPVVVEAIPVEEAVLPRGGYEYIRQPRKKQRESHEEREDIRRLIRAALEDDVPEAKAVAKLVKPYVAPKTQRIDWRELERRSVALDTALDLYEARRLQDAIDEDDEDVAILLLAI